MNVLLSATFGFALAAYQFRFAWLWPLALLHGLADWTTVLTANPLPDWAIGVVHTFYLGFGLWLVRATPRKSGTRRRRLLHRPRRIRTATRALVRSQTRSHRPPFDPGTGRLFAAYPTLRTGARRRVDGTSIDNAILSAWTRRRRRSVPPRHERRPLLTATASNSPSSCTRSSGGRRMWARPTAVRSTSGKHPGTHGLAVTALVRA